MRLLLLAVWLGAAPAGQYTVSIDTVKDNKTGLVWQRVTPSSVMSWSAALQYCGGLNLGAFTTGWRLPTIKELNTLIDESVEFGEKFDPAAFPVGPSNKSLWSSTPSSAFANTAWELDTASGQSQQSQTVVNLTVRCVH